MSLICSIFQTIFWKKNDIIICAPVTESVTASHVCYCDCLSGRSTFKGKEGLLFPSTTNTKNTRDESFQDTVCDLRVDPCRHTLSYRRYISIGLWLELWQYCAPASVVWRQSNVRKYLLKMVKPLKKWTKKVHKQAKKICCTVVTTNHGVTIQTLINVMMIMMKINDVD